MKKRYIFIFFLLFFIGIFNVNAYSNFNTSYIFDFNENFYDLNNYFGNYSQTYGQIFSSLKDLESSYYKIFITSTKSTTYITDTSQQEFWVYLYPSNAYLSAQITGKGTWALGENEHFATSTHSSVLNVKSFIFYAYNDVNNTHELNFYTSTAYTTFYDCYVNNSCPSSNGVYGAMNYYDRNNRTYSSFSISYHDDNLTFNNNDSFNLVANASLGNNLNNWIVYKNVPYIFTDSLLSGNNYFTKKLQFNDIFVDLDDTIPSYYDLFGFNNNQDDDSSYVMQFDSRLNTIYSKIPIDYVNNFKIDLSFSPINLSPLDYLDQLNGYNVLVSGRVNHTNYYTYEDLSCTFNDISSDIVDRVINVSFSNISCDSGVNLSLYDYIYFTIIPNYDYWISNASKDILGITLNSNRGYYTYQKYQASIYEYFEDLPANFKIFYSTSNDSGVYGNEVDFSTNSNQTFYTAYYIDTMFANNSFRGRISKNNDTFGSFLTITSLYLNDQSHLTKGYGYLIFDNGNTSSTNLTSFINSNIVVSLAQNNSNNFYYYNTDTDTIENSNINVEYEINTDTNDYDISQSINSIVSYIDDLRQYILDFRYLIQSFYDQLPTYIQGFVYIMFNIICLKTTISLLKNDSGKEE